MKAAVLFYPHDHVRRRLLEMVLRRRKNGFSEVVPFLQRLPRERTGERVFRRGDVVALA